PVIASLSGVDLVLVVAEPSISGISDLGRVIATAQTMGVETAICVNKYDTNLEKTRCIEEFCRSRGLPFSGKIPYDAVTMQAINQGISIVDIDCIAGTAVRKVYEETMQLLLGQNDGE
ncbi:MAG: ATPase, partial [Firmicutes bacterium]|nr:ATPase [Bacillota bacterium]